MHGECRTLARVRGVRWNLADYVMANDAWLG
jgi:hypothetical protein